MTISLNGEWKLKLDKDENGLAENWAAAPLAGEDRIQVPGCVQSIDAFAEEFPPHNDMRNGYLGTFFIEKTFTAPALSAGERVRLTLGAVMPCGHVWINGHYIEKHRFSVCRSVVDITDFITAGENRITVAVVEQYTGLNTGMRFSGADWSGIYSDSYIEIGAAVSFSEVYVSMVSDACGRLCGRLHNAGTAGVSGTVQAALGDMGFTFPVTVPAGKSVDFAVEIDVSGLPKWSYREPNLLPLRLALADTYGHTAEYNDSIGLRKITVEGHNICVNGQPTFFAGAGSEYYSIQICALNDKNILRRRFQALKDHGFNFYRCHTHLPTEEALAVADEMGIMLDVEFGLVSNFNKTTPFKTGLEMLKAYIRQTRRHPSLFIYCLGNEGSQLMVDSVIERNRAKAGYQVIKENTTEQFAIIAFGMQGELPELPNDLETPHLWSDNFLWGYDGLTDIPWDYLEQTTGGKPCIIHEYGKFGVWPSVEEERRLAAIPRGVKPDFGTQARLALEEMGCSEKEQIFIENSRKLCGICTRTILEEARRQPYVSGYALWLFFRRANGNAGVCTDDGVVYDGDPLIYKNGCNAEVALLMDRGFKNRTFAAGITEQVTVTLSNYSVADVAGGLRLTLRCGDTVIAEQQAAVEMPCGKTAAVASLLFTSGAECTGQRLEFTAELQSGGAVISKNTWDFWCFSAAPNPDVRAFLHLEDLTTERLIKKAFPKAARLSSVDSVVIGCRSWRDPKEAQTATAFPETVVVSDRYDAVIRECYEKGVKVLLIDNGRLPEKWIIPPISDQLGERDTGRFYSSFRAGWDKGNLLTVIEKDALLGDFPCEQFCDLQFYDMLQGARSVYPGVLRDTFGTAPKTVIEAVAKVPVRAENDVIVQDPNAIKEQTGRKKRSFNAREQGYLLKMEDGEKRLCVCTLKLTDNIAGLDLLKNILLHF